MTDHDIYRKMQGTERGRHRIIDINKSKIESETDKNRVMARRAELQ